MQHISGGVARRSKLTLPQEINQNFSSSPPQPFVIPADAMVGEDDIYSMPTEDGMQYIFSPYDEVEPNGKTDADPNYAHLPGTVSPHSSYLDVLPDGVVDSSAHTISSRLPESIIQEQGSLTTEGSNIGRGASEPQDQKLGNTQREQWPVHNPFQPAGRAISNPLYTESDFNDGEKTIDRIAAGHLVARSVLEEEVDVRWSQHPSSVYRVPLENAHYRTSPSSSVSPLYGDRFDLTGKVNEHTMAGTKEFFNFTHPHPHTHTPTHTDTHTHSLSLAHTLLSFIFFPVHLSSSKVNELCIATA